MSLSLRHTGGSDLLEIYEREDAIKLSKECPVCKTPYDDDGRAAEGRRHIKIITDCDSSDHLACPGCRPDQFLLDGSRLGYDARWMRKAIERHRLEREERARAV